MKALPVWGLVANLRREYHDKNVLERSMSTYVKTYMTQYVTFGIDLPSAVGTFNHEFGLVLPPFFRYRFRHLLA
jgi:hypothetical protein